MQDSQTKGDTSIPLMLFFCTAGICVAGYNHFTSQVGYQQSIISSQSQQIETLKQQLTQSEARFDGYVAGRR
ncbi:MAG: hypothetical protein WBB28_10735 [Crinalium sp.]